MSKEVATFEVTMTSETTAEERIRWTLDVGGHEAAVVVVHRSRYGQVEAFRALLRKALDEPVRGGVQRC